ncbi:MAG: hypothetical protein ABSB58_08310 [Gemmatimonadales bacterium]|jgi:hypothetical protein
MRRWGWAAAAGLAAAAVAAALMPHALVGIFYDDGIYAALARSLAEGHGYRLLYLPGAPAAVHYPPLYPAFLALLWQVWPSFPDNVVLFRAANTLLLGAFTGGYAAYLARRRALPAPAAALLVVVGATAVPLLSVVTVLFAEPLFLVLALGAWCLADAAAGAEGRRPLALAIGAGAAAGLAGLTRSIGVAVAGGVVLSLLLARRRREALASAAVALLFLVPWQVWTAAHRSGVPAVLAANYGTYGDLLRQAGWRWINPDLLWDVLRPLGYLAFAAVRPVWHPWFGAPALVVLVIGCVALARKAPALGWSLALYMAVVLLRPYAPDRFLWAVLPLLVVALAMGGVAVWRAGGERGDGRRWALRALAVAGIVPALVGFGRYQVIGFTRRWPTMTQREISETFERILPWVRSATPENAVLAGEDEALLWLYSGRQAVPSYLWHLEGRRDASFGPDSLHAFLDRSDVSYVIVTGPRSEAAPAIDALHQIFPGYLTPVMMWPGPMEAFAVDHHPPPPPRRPSL